MAFNYVLLLIFLGIIAGFCAGYAWCYIKYGIDDLQNIADITADIIADKISVDEALKKIKELDDNNINPNNK